MKHWLHFSRSSAKRGSVNLRKSRLSAPPTWRHQASMTPPMTGRADHTSWRWLTMPWGWGSKWNTLTSTPSTIFRWRLVSPIETSIHSFKAALALSQPSCFSLQGWTWAQWSLESLELENPSTISGGTRLMWPAGWTALVSRTISRWNKSTTSALFNLWHRRAHHCRYLDLYDLYALSPNRQDIQNNLLIKWQSCD